MIQSIVACPKTLVELVLDPDCHQDDDEFDERVDALNQLKSLIHSYKVNLYVLPSSLMVLHAYLRRSANHNFANRAISELLALGNVVSSLDYEHNIETAVALLQAANDHHVCLGLPLHEALMVPVAMELKASVIVATDPEQIRQLAELCSFCPGFDSPVLNVREAVDYLLTQERYSFSVDGDVLARTPKGTIKKLRKGATVIDFAYAIHTEIGSRCVGALVNHEEAPLDRVIAMNDMVEILLGDRSQTQESWLEFAKTRTARKAIKQSIRKGFQDRGWDLVRQEFNLRTMRPQLDLLAKTMGLTTNRLMERLGRGQFSLADLSMALQQMVIDQLGQGDGAGSPQEFLIGPPHPRWRQNLSSCCMPFPGDEVVGIVGIRDDVIRIHRRTCDNITEVKADKRTAARWGCDRCSVELYLVMKDNPDTLRQILNHLAEHNGLVTDLRSVQISKDLARSTITLPISSRQDLDQILASLQAMPNVSQVKVKKTYPLAHPSDPKAELHPPTSPKAKL